MAVYIYAESGSPDDSGNSVGNPGSRTGGGDTTAIVSLDTLSVSTSRTTYEASSITTLSAETFTGRFTDLPAVLEQVSGVSVRRTGGFGEYADVSIRGGSSKQVQVYLDGIPLNSAAGGAVDLSKIPLGTLRDVAVYKGTAPLELMGTSAGAVISLRSGRVNDCASGVLELGSFGYRKAGTMLRKKFGSMTHLFSIDYSGARNDYPYEDDNGTPYNPDDDAEKLKSHNAFTMFGVNYTNTWQPRPAHRITTLLSFTDEHQDLFHKQLVDTLQLAGLSSGTLLGRIDWESELSESGTLDTRFEGRWKRGLFDDPLGQLYMSGSRREQEDFPFAAFQCATSKALNSHLTIKALIRGGGEGYRSVNLLAPAEAAVPPAALRLTGAAAGELSAHRKNGGAVFRYNHVYVRDSSNFLPNHGSGKPLPQVWSNHFPNGNIDLFWNPRSWCTVDGSFRHEYLPVSLSDRFGWGANYRGNPRLRPERRLEGSIGFILRHSLFESSVSVFSGATFDMIELQPQSQRILMAINSGKVRLTGIEWDIHVAPHRTFAIDNHFTVIDKTRLKQGAGKWKPVPLLFFSPVENDLRITLTRKWLSAGHSLHYRSPFYEGYTAATDRVTPLPALNAFISLSPLRQVTFTYRCENYLNVTYAPVAYYTPLPGRMHFFIGKIQW